MLSAAKWKLRQCRLKSVPEPTRGVVFILDILVKHRKIVFLCRFSVCMRRTWTDDEGDRKSTSLDKSLKSIREMRNRSSWSFQRKLFHRNVETSDEFHRTNTSSLLTHLQAFAMVFCTSFQIYLTLSRFFFSIFKIRRWVVVLLGNGILKSAAILSHRLKYRLPDWSQSTNHSNPTVRKCLESCQHSTNRARISISDGILLLAYLKEEKKENSKH